MVSYRFEDNRSGECVRRHLGGYGGILQMDGYAAYNQLVRKDGGNAGPRLAGCWATSRRRFYELHTAGDTVRSPPPRSNGWPISGSSNPRFVTKAPMFAPPRGRPFPPPSSPDCSPSLATDPAAHLGQIEAGRGHPPCHRPARHLRAIPDGWPDRTRLQHRRARHQTPDHHQEEQPLRRIGRGRSHMGNNRHPPADHNVDPTAWLTQTLERIANQKWPSAKIDALMPSNYTL